MSGCPGQALSALVDDALDHDERDRVLAHLAGCSTCRAEVEAERSLKLRLSTLSARTPAPTPELLARLQGLAVPGVEPAGRPRREAAPAVAVGRPVPAPSSRRPGAGRPPGRSRRRRSGPRKAGRGVRRGGTLGAGLLLLGVGLALALGSPAAGGPSTPVDPGSDDFVVDFVSTTPVVPLADPAGRAALLPRP